MPRKAPLCKRRLIGLAVPFADSQPMGFFPQRGRKLAGVA